MTDNTVKDSKGNSTDVYKNEIELLVDQYINKELDNPDDMHDISTFTGMILYISDNIPKPSNDDIELLDNIFNIYIRLCCKYKLLPTLECFSMMVNINPNTLSSWKNGEYRGGLGSPHSLAVKKWKDTCARFLVNSLSNTRGTDANRIFIAKAAYGMVETAPMQTVNQSLAPAITQAELVQQFGEQALIGGKEADF